MNWYSYASSNPINFVDPSGLVEVSLREYLNKVYGISNDYIIWDPVTIGVTVTFMGTPQIFYGYIPTEGPYKGVMRIDDQILLQAFGLHFVEPSVTSLFDKILETIPIVSYGQAAIGLDLDGRPLTSEQRLEKLGLGINASGEAFINGLTYSGNIKTAGMTQVAYVNMRNTIGKQGTNQFINAMKKGPVGAKGQNGIKMLSDNSSYQFEVKVFGEFSNYRLYGNYDNTGRIVFTYFGKALH